MLELPAVNARTIRATTELVLSNKGIEALWGFDRLVNLESLWVDGNKLDRIENMDRNIRVKHLYAARNRLVTLEGSLVMFKYLKELDLSHNRLAMLDSLLDVLCELEYLERLELHHNPAAGEVDCRARAIAAIPSLRTLDSRVISPSERTAAERKYSRLSRRHRIAARQPTLTAAASGLRGTATAGAPQGRRTGEWADPEARHGALAVAGLDTGKLTSSGKPMFGQDYDTATLRQVKETAAAARRRRAHERAAANAAAAGTSASDAAASLEAAASQADPVLAATLRAGRRAPGEPLRSALAEQVAEGIPGIIERSVAAAMLTRGVAADDVKSCSRARPAYEEARLLRKTKPHTATGKPVDPLAAAVKVGMTFSAVADPDPAVRKALARRQSNASNGSANSNAAAAAAGGPVEASLRSSARLAGSSNQAAQAAGAASPSLAATLTAAALADRPGRPPMLPRHPPTATAAAGQRVLMGSMAAATKALAARMAAASEAGPGAQVPVSPMRPAASGAPLGRSGRRVAAGAAGKAPVAAVDALLSTVPRVDRATGRTLSRSERLTRAKDRAAREVFDVNGAGVGDWEGALLRRLFEMADADRSGELDLEELLDAVHKAADWGLVVDAPDPDMALGRLFRAVDTDNSGAIDWREFISLVSGVPHKKASGVQTLRAAGKFRSRRHRRQAEGKESGPSLLESAKAASAKAAASSRGEGAGRQSVAAAQLAAEVPRLRFRCMTAEEADQRASGCFRRAARAQRRAERMDEGSSGRKQLEASAMELATRGSRLQDLARGLRGAFDPPEEPAAAPKPRSDVVGFLSSVPLREARKTLERGNRMYRPAPPGEESDSDSDEDDDERGSGDQFERFRRRRKARKPHVVLRSAAHL